MIELTIFVLSGLAVRRATGESANLVTSSSNSSMETNSSSTFFLTSQSDYVSNSSVNHLNWQNVLILCLFSPIVIVSLCGNLLVCRTLLVQRRLRANSTNVLIGVLAISDLLMTGCNLPFTIFDIILKDWIFGDFFCTLVSFVQANSVIAINRWRVIYKFQPLSNTSQSQPHSPSTNQSCATTRQTRQTLISSRAPTRYSCCSCLPNRWLRRRTMEMDSEVSMELQNIHQKPELIKSANTRFKVKLSANTKLALIIFAIWFLAALHSLPHTVFNRVKTIRVLNKMHTDGNRTLSEEELNARTVTVRRCIPVWPKELGTNFNLYLTIFTTITQYFIPLSCAGFIYLRIALTVQQLGKVGEISRGKAEQLTKKKRRRLLMLFFSFACFALSWAPFQIYYLLLDFGVTKTTNYVSFLSVLWVATSSVCWNPCVLAFFNESFKAEAKAVLQRLKSCCTYGG